MDFGGLAGTPGRCLPTQIEGEEPVRQEPQGGGYPPG